MEQYQEQYRHILEQYESENKKNREEETTVYASIEKRRKGVKICLIAEPLLFASFFGFLVHSFDEDAQRGTFFWSGVITFSVLFSMAALVAKVIRDRVDKKTLFEIQRKKKSLEENYKKQRCELQSAINSEVSTTTDFQKKLSGLNILLEIDPSNNSYLSLQRKYCNVKALCDSLVPKLISEKYGEVNIQYLQTCQRINTSLIDENISDYSSLIYANALDEDFCIYRFVLWSKCLTDICSDHDIVDLMAAIIIVHSRNSHFDEIIDYNKNLSAWIERAKSESLISLASISAWCGCKETEFKILEKLENEKKLSEALFNRYIQLRSI